MRLLKLELLTETVELELIYNPVPCYEIPPVKLLDVTVQFTRLQKHILAPYSLGALLSWKIEEDITPTPFWAT